MAGLAETRLGPEADDFWSWRDLMYRLVGMISPEDMTAIAAMAFMEMLEAGFTRVGEFHYLHHQPSGQPYTDPATMAGALAAAAQETGIALTLLPVFYAHAGFGGQAPHEGQRRFICDVEGFARLREASHRAVSDLPDAVVGIAPHSLRAVTPGELTALVALAPKGPIHIHIAEQIREVDDCLAWSARRPVEWLMDQHAIDERWCLVHATHMNEQELTRVAKSGAIVGLCPVTEANLGDGIFPAVNFIGAGGRFGIGSDSNVRINAAEEMRLLEYGQRLSRRQRTVLAEMGRSNGRMLFDPMVTGGAIALGVGAGIRIGASADIVALYTDPLGLADRALDRWIFGNGSLESVWRAGRKVVSEGRHHHREAIEHRFNDVSRRLVA
jgi:formiminoglutamate deiminase